MSDINIQEILHEHKLFMIAARGKVNKEILTETQAERAANSKLNGDSAVAFYLDHRHEYTNNSLTTHLHRILRERPTKFGPLTWNEINFCLRFPNIVLRPGYDFSIEPPELADMKHYLKSLIPNTPDNVMAAMMVFKLNRK